MIKCSEECEPLCDFCKNFISDKDSEEDGHCKVTGESVSLTDACEDNFHCFRVEEQGELNEI